MVADIVKGLLIGGAVWALVIRLNLISGFWVRYPPANEITCFRERVTESDCLTSHPRINL